MISKLFYSFNRYRVDCSTRRDILGARDAMWHHLTSSKLAILDFIMSSERKMQRELIENNSKICLWYVERANPVVLLKKSRKKVNNSVKSKSCLRHFENNFCSEVEDCIDSPLYMPLRIRRGRGAQKLFARPSHLLLKS